MAVSKAQQASVNKYVKANYDRINVTMPKGEKEVIQGYAATAGESVNGFIVRAVRERMERDGSAAAVPGAAPVERVLAETAAGAPQEAPGRPAGAGVVYLPSDTLEAAQRAAEGGMQPAPVDKVKAAEELFSILGDLGAVDLDQEKCERLGIVYMPPDALEAAHLAAERTGETVPAFVARAVEEQQKRDNAAFKLGINPASGGGRGHGRGPGGVRCPCSRDTGAAG